ncbi:Aste57867_8727 [Aphanomyces stellatus]|uniref:Aste57867_8727 protein n=1 Tax=Aphanomyces stellatus TaxID=120398 RepID=A0A485KL67_9STRA|nr:hypothetical protein As57867_008693 [Aphanomyces stellatus]VFT85613.1 Aste57867_8727 [Aphanomyces stellatus]
MAFDEDLLAYFANTLPSLDSVIGLLDDDDLILDAPTQLKESSFPVPIMHHGIDLPSEDGSSAAPCVAPFLEFETWWAKSPLATLPLPSQLMQRPAPLSNHKHHQQPPSPLRKLCDFHGCVKFARSQGMCTEHGGRRYCDEPNCPRVAQFGGKCTTHGGVKPCVFPGCTKAVQSRGMCKGHGGGVRCKVPGCTKGSISKGLCRGHGGGQRCETPGCTKWAQRDGHCVRHHHATVAGHVVSELV